MDASRGATLAVHAAAGLAAAHSREAARLLRAAEGLCRAASAALFVGTGPPATTAADLTSAGAATKQRRRKRGGRRRAGQPDAEPEAVIPQVAVQSFGEAAEVQAFAAAEPTNSSRRAAAPGGEWTDPDAYMEGNELSITEAPASPAPSVAAASTGSSGVSRLWDLAHSSGPEAAGMLRQLLGKGGHKGKDRNDTGGHKDKKRGGNGKR